MSAHIVTPDTRLVIPAEMLTQSDTATAISDGDLAACIDMTHTPGQLWEREAERADQMEADF